MKRVPFPIIVAAKQSNVETIDFIRHYFEGYIANRFLGNQAVHGLYPESYQYDDYGGGCSETNSLQQFFPHAPF